MFMTYPYNKYQMLGFIGSFVIAIKPQADLSICLPSILLLYFLSSNSPNESCVFI